MAFVIVHRHEFRAGFISSLISVLASRQFAPQRAMSYRTQPLASNPKSLKRLGVCWQNTTRCLFGRDSTPQPAYFPGIGR